MGGWYVNKGREQMREPGPRWGYVQYRDRELALHLWTRRYGYWFVMGRETPPVTDLR